MNMHDGGQRKAADTISNRKPPYFALHRTWRPQLASRVRYYFACASKLAKLGSVGLRRNDSCHANPRLEQSDAPSSVWFIHL
jgi:hypothetical protein